MLNFKKLFVLLLAFVLFFMSTSSTLAETDLKGYVIDAKINGTSEEITVKKGQEYSVEIFFKESEGNQFPETGMMTYTLPAGLKGVTNSGNIDIVLTDPQTGARYTIENNPFTVSDSNITFNFNKTDEDFINHFHDFTNVDFHISFKGKFDGSQKEIKFSDTISQTISIDNTKGVSISKNPSFDKKSGIVTYTLYLTSTGDNTNVVAADTIGGTALVYQNDAHIVYEHDPAPTFTHSNTGFSATIPSMKDGETIQIQYTAKLDETKLDSSTDRGVLTYDETRNTVSVVSNEDSTGSSSSNSLQYQTYLTADKSGILSENGKTIIWTITLNQEQFMSLAGTKITDTIAEDVRQYLNYSGGLTIAVTDENGQTTTRTISQSEAGITGVGDYNWEYKIPETDGKFKYVITYQTSVDDTTLLVPTSAKNTVDTPVGEKEASVTIGPKPDEKLQISKSATSISTTSVTWQISYVLPANKNFNSVVLTDKYPYHQEHYYQDTFTELVSIDGLKDNESYTLDTTTSNQNFTLTFYKDTQKNQPGLLTDTSNRTITVTFKTAVDQNWLNASETSPYLKAHKNTANLDINGTIVAAEAQAAPANIKITKENQNKLNNDTVQPSGIAEIEGVKLPFYRFAITLEGITENQITLTDEFNTDIFRLYSEYPYQYTENWQTYTTYNMKIIGGDENNIFIWNNNAIGDINHTSTSSGETFTVTLPTQSDGGLYGRYMLIYYLIVKNENALLALKKLAAAEDDFSATLTNTATYNDVPNSATITYDYKPVEKTLLNSDSLGEQNRIAQYQIVINPAAETLNNGENMTLTDTFSENLNILYNTISITPSDAVLTYNVSGYTATYVIKDSTAVTITYNAMILGTGPQSINNSAKISGSNWESTISETKSMSSDGGGSGTSVGIQVLKHEKGKMNNRLSGAEFTLYDGKTNQVMTYSNGSVAVFRTNDNGIATIVGGNGLVLYEDHPYYLIETKTPLGYNKDSGNPSGKWGFTLTSDPKKVDTDTYKYPLGYTMRIANEAKNTSLVLRKTISGAFSADTLPADQKQNIIFTVTSMDSSYQRTIPYNDFTDGSYTLNDITPGTYYVTETIPTIEGYTVNTNYSVTVTGDSADSDSATVVVTASDTEKAAAHQVNITNNYQNEGGTTSVTATKAWSNAGGTSSAPTGARVVFTLYQTIGASTTFTNYTVTLDGTADTSAPETAGGYESAPWKATFVNLPAKDGTTDITYTVAETTGWAGYTASTNQPVANGGTITNTENTGTIKLQATKSINQWPSDNRLFEFELSGVDNSDNNQGNAAAKLSDFTENQKKKNATKDQSTVTFGPITFGASDKGKEFTFKITENEPEGTDQTTHIYQGVKYDPVPHTVIVKPQVDDSTGDISFKVIIVDQDSKEETISSGGTVEAAATIKNTYNATSKETLQISKALSGGEWPDGSVEFTLTAKDRAPMPKNEGGDKVTLSSTETLTGSFGEIEYNLKDARKTYEYEINETQGFSGWTKTGPVTVTVKVGDDNGDGTLKPATITYDPANHTITNTKITGAGLQFKATKSMKDGGKWPAGREFNIILEADGNDKLQGFTDLEQQVSKDNTNATLPSTQAIQFTGSEIGTQFKFKIYEEKHGTISYRVKYDETVKTVIIKPVQAADGTSIKLTYSLDNGTSWHDVNNNIIEVGNFVNEYTATGTSVTFSGTKTLTGKAMTNEQFSFNIKNTANEIVGTCANDTTGKITCTPINYTLADAGKTYTYTVTEDLTGVDPTTHKKEGITYDYAKSYEVTVKVEDNGNGTITATPSENYNKLNFTNSYDATGAVQFKAKKELKNGTLTANQFSFNLTKLDGTIIETVQNDAQGNIAFTRIAYTLNDLKNADDTYAASKTFDYIIEEVIPKTLTGSDTVYDSSKYTITVTVTDNGTGTLYTGVSVKDAGNNTVDFTNIPDTDGTHIITLGKNFTNSKIQPVTVPLTATKGLREGADKKSPASDQVWDFTLKAIDGGPLPPNTSCTHSSDNKSCTVRNSSGSIDFGTISFDHRNLGDNQSEKEYKYQITETLRTTNPKSPDNISPDPNEKIIFVKLSLVNGALTAEVSEEVNSQRKTITPSDGKYNIGEFTNIYVADGSILFEATKAFKKDGKDVSWPEGAVIELVLAAKNETSDDPAYKKLSALDTEAAKNLKQTVSSEKKTATFPAFSFSRAEAEAGQTYYFVITETAGTNTSISYDKTKQYIRVVPRLDSRQVKLSVSVSTDDSTYTDKTSDITNNTLNVGTFTNSYTASGSLVLSANKLINVWPKGAKFEFSISGVDDKSHKKVANFAHAIAEDIAEDEDLPVAKFEAIPFDQFDIGETFTFNITEENGGLSSITYSQDTKPISVKVLDNGDGTLKLVDPTDETKIISGPTTSPKNVGTFENVYEAEGTLNLKARKIVIGADETVDESHTFHFILRYNDAGETETHHKVTGTVTTTKDGEYAFIKWDPIIYKLTDSPSDVSAYQTDLQWLIDHDKATPGKTEDGNNKWTVNYMLEEDTSANKTKANEDIDIDHHHLPVTVTIIDNGDGTLSCTQEGLNTSDPSSIPTFTNHEVHDGSITISAKKELNGRALTDADKWTFTLEPHSSNPDAPMPEVCSTTATSCAPQNNNKGEVKFPPIHFTFEDLDQDKLDIEDLEHKNGQKTYKYTITESGGGFAGVTNDADPDRVFSITLWLVRDAQGVESLQFKVEDENGKEINRITETGTNLFNTYPAATFVNKYEASGTVKLAVTKSMQGDIWPFNGEFEFEITEDTNNQPMKYKGTSTVKVRKPETGKTSTAEFTGFDYFTQDDINKQFTYTIKEENGGTTANGVSYSGEEYTIVITPKPDGNYIKPEVKVTSKLQKGEVQPISITSDGEGTYSIVAGNFENSYTASGTAELKATKALAEGSTWPAGKSVTFTLSDVSENQYKPAPLPKKDGVETTELSVSKAGEISFGTLTSDTTISERPSSTRSKKHKASVPVGLRATRSQPLLL